MPVNVLKSLRNALIVTTLFPVLWFLVAGLSVMRELQLIGLEHPALIALVYAAFWATPLLILIGLALSGWAKSRGHPLPRFSFAILLASGTIWLVQLGILSFLPD